MGHAVSAHHIINEEARSRINEFRKNGKYCDIKITVEGVEFPAHKVILSGFSPYFDAMFSGDFLEAGQDIVTLESVDLCIMEDLLEFAYTSVLDLTGENIQALLHAANFLQVKALFYLCCEFLEQNINVESCLDIYNVSDMYSCTELHEKVKTFILKNFSDVCQEVGFLELPPEKLIELIDDSSLCAEKEEHVFDAVLQWFHYKQEERELHLPNVLNRVRLTKLDPYFLRTRLKMTEALQKSESCMNLLLDVFSYHSLPNRRLEIHSSCTKQRSTDPYIEALLLYVSCDTSNVQTNLCVNEDCTFEKTVPDFFNLNNVLTTSSKDMYIVDNRRIMRFDYKNEKWLPEVSLPVPDKAVYNFDGRWYAFGLSESDSDIIWYSNSTPKASPEWTTIKPMLEEVCNPGVVSLEGMLYIVGGKDKQKTASSRMQRFDPFTETWSIVTSLPAPWKTLKACALDGCIYVFSDNSLDDALFEKWRCDVYLVSTNQWKTCSPVPSNFVDHSVLKAITYKGDIYVLLEKLDKREVLVYSPAADSWRDFPNSSKYNIISLKGSVMIKNSSRN